MRLLRVIKSHAKMGGDDGGALTVSHFEAIILAADWRKMAKGPNRKLEDQLESLGHSSLALGACDCGGEEEWTDSRHFRGKTGRTANLRSKFSLKYKELSVWPPTFQIQGL